MSKRHRDAIMIQKGACNPSGIANSIVEACREARDEGCNAVDDAAVRLMVHQLAFITKIRGLDDGDGWREAIRECEEKGGVTL